MKKTKQNNNFLHAPRSTLHAVRGFTLIEMLVSIAIFSFVMLATTSVLLSVIDANHKAQGLKTAIDNLSLALESMTRDLRTGSGYIGSQCSGSGCNEIVFTDHNGCVVGYALSSGGAIVVSKLGDSPCKGYSSSMTAQEITIDHLNFYISGENSADTIQPRVLITVGGYVNSLIAAGAKTKTGSRFDIQTFVSQRLPDVPPPIPN